MILTVNCRIDTLARHRPPRGRQDALQRETPGTSKELYGNDAVRSAYLGL